MDAREIFIERRGSLGRVETANPEQLRRPIVEKTGEVERPASHVRQPLPFGEIELASLFGALAREADAGRILQGDPAQPFVFVVVRRHYRPPMSVAASRVPSTRARILA